MRQRRQLRARLHLARDVAHDEPCRVTAQFLELARQQVAFRLMRADERVKRLGVSRGRHANLQIGQRLVSPQICDQGSYLPSATGRVASSSTAFGKRSSPAARRPECHRVDPRRASVTMYGGSSRTTVVDVRLIEQAALERRADDRRRVVERDRGRRSGRRRGRP